MKFLKLFSAFLAPASIAATYATYGCGLFSQVSMSSCDNMLLQRALGSMSIGHVQTPNKPESTVHLSVSTDPQAERLQGRSLWEKRLRTPESRYGYGDSGGRVGRWPEPQLFVSLPAPCLHNLPALCLVCHFHNHQKCPPSHGEFPKGCNEGCKQDR